MKASKGRPLWGLARAKVELPLVFFYCSLFFLAGFYGSLLFSVRFSGGRVPRGRLLEVEKEVSDLPGMPHGETGESRPSSVAFQVLSWKPRAVYFPKFATEEECRNIIKVARPSLEPSTLALREGETVENTKGIRTSSGTFISASEDSTGILDQIEQKISRVTMIPRENMESFNILRYEIGQKYASHYDVFNPAEYGPQQSNRVATFLIYLTDVEEGGETMFPYENGLNMDIGYDYEKCIGLKVKPRQGDGLLFYSMFTNHTIDPLSLHGSCPVIKGEKWVATKWIRDQIQDNM
ncbi:probable prolyl 4-hydroxylase 9 [Phoenix dactylifera]|uniref:procollagen-proline 4-dioxygenase n=1 Tax=Phoenix dactylifera TaxID=42345 RepID=A0A8B7CVG6_PHODC|nr:probable prolyl 4-hydroxylase 9 [Phoenix dactylifera]